MDDKTKQLNLWTAMYSRSEILEKMLEILGRVRHGDTVWNPYLDKKVLNNLAIYLGYMLDNNNGVLLVGEAPGWRGAAICGIPFTCGTVIESSKNPFFIRNKKGIYLSRVVWENTATQMWEVLDDHKVLPVLWNIFPFHPHVAGDRNSNRKPLPNETDFGLKFVKFMMHAYEPKYIIAIGRVAEDKLKQAFPETPIGYIRHPSYGGDMHFKHLMAEMFKNHFGAIFKAYARKDKYGKTVYDRW